MINYKLLMIEDNDEDGRKIRAAIKTWIRKNKANDSIEFCNLDLNADTDDINSLLVETIFEKEIDSVLIDYKLLTNDNKYNGNSLFSFIKDRSPLFPCIVLTNNYRDCVEEKKIDQDKIYLKEEFLDTTEGKERSDQLMDNLFTNIDSRNEKIREIEKSINDLLEESKSEDSDTFPLSKLLKYDNLLNSLQPSLSNDSINESLDGKYAELFDLIDKVKAQLDEKM